MAELLIKAIDATHPDPVEDQAGSYKRGDVVIVCEDGCPWGAREVEAPVGGGWFCTVTLSGESVASLELFAEPETTQVFNPTLDAMVDEIVTCRAWRLNIDELPPPAQNALDSPGQVNLPTSVFLAAMERKADGVRGNTI